MSTKWSLDIVMACTKYIELNMNKFDYILIFAPLWNIICAMLLAWQNNVAQCCTPKEEHKFASILYIYND